MQLQSWLNMLSVSRKHSHRRHHSNTANVDKDEVLSGAAAHFYSGAVSAAWNEQQPMSWDYEHTYQYLCCCF